MKCSILLSLFLLGDVFITSCHFMNVENDAKAYFIGIAVFLLLLFVSLFRKGLYGLKESLFNTRVIIGFTIVCLLLSAYGIMQFYGIVPSRHYAFPITGTYENPAGFAAVQAALFPFASVLCFDKEQKRLISWLAGLTAVACALTITLSGSRAGLLAICAAAAVVFAFKTKVLSILKTHKWLWIVLTFVAVISSDENILKRKPTDGRQFTALVFDDGSSNIKVALMYRMGTTDKCVAKGNVSGGALLLTNSFEINAAGINDYSKRAEFIFKNVFEQAEKVK